jgi:hypothetical protein
MGGCADVGIGFFILFVVPSEPRGSGATEEPSSLLSAPSFRESPDEGGVIEGI